jgi:hypothetical protein
MSIIETQNQVNSDHWQRRSFDLKYPLPRIRRKANFVPRVSVIGRAQMRLSSGEQKEIDGVCGSGKSGRRRRNVLERPRITRYV